MSQDIHRLVYYSRNRTSASADAMTIEIKSILAASRRNNPSVDVTGALMFNAGCFAQVLEGPKAAVEHTFERIQRDERHGDVFVLSFGPVEERAFEGWSMAFVGESAAHQEQFGSVAEDSGFDPSCMTGEAVFGVLQRLMREDEAVAASCYRD